MRLTEQARDRLLTDAEQKIRSILIDLEDASGEKIDNVRVDTRNFSNLNVEIFLH